MAGYIGSKASVVSSGAERKKTFTITGATTSLTGLNYTVGKVHVFQNGVRLVDGTDYTATNGTTITLTVAAQSGDNVVVISQAAFQVADALLTSGGTLTGDLSFGDNDKAIFGAGSDLQIYHDGSHSYIAEGGSATGSLRIRGENLLLEDNSGKDYLNAVADAQVELSYNGSKKFETTSTGIAVTGSTAHTAGDITNTISGTYNLNGANGTAGSAAYVTYSFKDDPNTGMYRAAADTLTFATGGSERMRIDNKGMVGIKHSMPSDVSGDCTSIRVGGLSTIRGVTNTTGSQNFHTGLTYNSYPTSSGADKAYVSTSGSDFKPVKYAQVAGSNIWYNASTATAGSDITWSERMRINPNGRINTYGTGNVNGALNLLGEGGASFRAISFEHTNGGGEKGSITTSASSTSYNTSSDYRLKENVVDLTGASARVNQLNPSRFNFIADDTNTLVDGFLAHEVATVVPEAITGTKDAMMDEEYEVTPAVLDEDGNVTTEAVMGTRSVPDYQGIDQSKLVPLLTAALQEALTEIASLKTRVEALEA
ncbi:tail fiber domain-containing protein [bacterium]|nr:tail fiber domain-containing protein [bacterium]